MDVVTVTSPRRLLCFLLALAAFTPLHAADLDEIIRRGTETLHSDWKADPDFAYVERDEVTKGGKTTVKSWQVVTIDGSEYKMPIAVDDRPLPPEQRSAELEKLRNEAERRKNESPEARAHRIAAYEKQRNENGELLLDFPNAFNFELKGEETLNGHPSYVLAATPKHRDGHLSLAAKVLSGMTGTLWLDKEHYHVVRAACEVFRSVPVYGILAKVLPGTHIEIEEQPANDSVWLVSRVSMDLALAKLWIHSAEVTNTTYSDYKLNTDELRELLNKAPGQ